MPSSAMKRIMSRVAQMEAQKAIDTRGPMFVDPMTHYDADYWAGRKLYRYPDGKGGWELRCYAPPAREWHGFQYVVNGLLGAMGEKRPRNVIDVGSGPGSFVAHLCDAGIDAIGLDVSDDAVANPAKGAVVCKWNIAQGPPPPDLVVPSDLVTATDLLEHVFERDLDGAIESMLSLLAPGGLFFACVCTAADECEVFTLRDEKMPVPFDHEWVAVAGHVNVRLHSYWVERFEAHGCRVRWDVMHRFAQYWARDARPGQFGPGGAISWGPRFILAADR